MRVLIVGGGGREHAIGYKVAQSPLVSALYFAPGNGGTAAIGTNVDIKVDEVGKLRDFAVSEKIGLTIVGPELPLALGIVDSFKAAGLKIFGPDKEGARLESSKSYSKEFMNRHGIPTGDSVTCSSSREALDYLGHSDYPIVIKADGLAAGKGVVICEDYSTAKAAIAEIMEDRIFGDQGSRVVIEEFLEGREVSLLCFTDSKTILPMESASDYKRAYDNDEGPNTGGMGSVSPAPYYEAGSCDYIAQLTLEGIKADGLDIKGVVYIGLILTKEGPKVLEYNMRFGDPETEALLPRLKSDLVEVIINLLAEKLDEVVLSWSDDKAVTVVIAGKGYPSTPETGVEIILPEQEGVMVFHSATVEDGGRLFSSGGRVLAVTALGETMREAGEKCYRFIERANFPGGFYRKDIGE